MKLCVLSQQHFRNLHVSQDMIDAFETAVSCDETIDTLRINISEFVFKLNRKFGVGGVLSSFINDRKAIQAVKNYNPDFVLVMAMGPGNIANQIPLLKKIRCKKIAYCIDTWQSSMPQWESVLKEAQVDIVFCAYKSSVEKFKTIVPNVYFLPQSFNEKWFYPRDNVKNHLMMQMGRKNKSLDEYAQRYILEKNLNDSDYIREIQKGQIIYPEFSQLGEEVAHTSFFILAPRDVDEGSVTGNISDVTARFYEGMASKTLLIGYKPRDTFDDLFPYKDAMIEVSSYEEFRDKVDFYLGHPSSYQAIVDKNYNYLMEHHRWKNRVDEMIQILSTL